MKKEVSYIPCKWCAESIDLDPEILKNTTCICKGTGQVIDPKSILCNMCGESMCHTIKTLSGTWESDRPEGLHEAHVTGGYESYHLLDLTTYAFSICESCLRQMFMKFKVKPTLHDAMDRNPYTWEEDQDVYEERLWKDAGEFHQAYLNRKCNKHRTCGKEAVYTVLLSDEFTEDACCEDHKDSWHNCVNAKLVKFIPNVLKPFL